MSAPRWYRSNFKHSKFHVIAETIDSGNSVVIYKARCGDSIGVPPGDPGAVVTRSTRPEPAKQCVRCQRKDG